jgi:predicted transposase/invertase (TIGR01784 family)
VLFRNVSEFHLRFRLLEDRLHFPFSEDLEFHVLELPKFNKRPEELSGDLDFWFYFLRYAEKMDTENLPDALRRPIFQRAVEELQMLTKNDIERELYEARRKAQLDQVSSLKDARLDGREEGRILGRGEGVQIGRIRTLEQVLSLPVTPEEQLAELTLDESTSMAERLQAQFMRT